ncbi:MAG: hypothetical protein ACK5R0_16900, partial [Bacteroidota bacterium]
LGREGMGKSSAIAQYIQDSEQVYYLRIGTTYTISNLLNELLYQLTDVYPTVSETLFDKMKKLSFFLSKDNTKRLVIIDDAGRLSARGLSTWFELRDNTISTTGFVFIGLDYFQKNLLRAKKNGVPGIAEFYRRVENWYWVPGLKKNEITAYGVEKKLTQNQLMQLAAAGIETIAELENTVSAMLEEAELAEKESRQPKNISVPGKPPANDEFKSKSRKVKNPGNEDFDDESENEDNELEDERLREKKIQGAKRAREAKAKKQKPHPVDTN